MGSGLFHTPHRSRGRIIGVVGVIADITHRKTVEQELKASNDRFTVVMDAVDALVYVADMKTHELLFLNRHGRKNFGNVVGKVCWQVCSPTRAALCILHNERLMDPEGKPAGIHVWEFRNTINDRWYECRDQAIRWTDGRCVRLEIATDMTQRMRDKEQLVHQNKFLIMFLSLSLIHL